MPTFIHRWLNCSSHSRLTCAVSMGPSISFQRHWRHMSRQRSLHRHAFPPRNPQCRTSPHHTLSPPRTRPRRKRRTPRLCARLRKWDDHVMTGPFSRAWWIYLGLTGLALDVVSSCTWAGLFAVATVGFSTIKQLWTLLSDVRVSPSLWLK
jgi:Dolichyl-phosphate-mannose-protein mannosyltransferase